MLAAHHGLDNLVAIIDYNKMQALGHTKDVIDLEPFTDKWKAFRWAVREVDGHDCGALESVLSNVPFEKGKPSCLIAHTVKGKGVSFMEDSLLWHYRNPRGEEFERAMAELEAKQ
jgi:transketolase